MRLFEKAAEPPPAMARRCLLDFRQDVGLPHDEEFLAIHLHREGLIPWVWSRGGLAVEEGIRSLFAKGVESYGSKKYAGWSGGSVSLPMIPVPWESATDFALEANGIIAQTQKVLEAINPVFIKKFIAAFMPEVPEASRGRRGTLDSQSAVTLSL